MTEETKKLESPCPPCEVVEIFEPQAIDAVCKPCPVKDEDPNALLYPQSRFIDVRDDCLREMLIAMTTQKFCKVPPSACK